jgi:hypothetical protein
MSLSISPCPASRPRSWGKIGPLLAAMALAACSGTSPMPEGSGGSPGGGGGASGGSTGGASGGSTSTPTGGGPAGGSATGGTSASGGSAGATDGSGGSGGSEPPLDAAIEAPPSGTPDGAAGSGPAAGSGGAPGDGTPGSKRHAVLVWGYGEHQPTPAPTAKPMQLDLTMKARLEAKGLVVDLAEDAASKVSDVTGKALLVISSSINRTNLFDAGKPRFKDVAVPTIVMKDGTIEVMGLGMGGMGGFSTDVGEKQITIVAPGDALAAGFMGNVSVYSNPKGDRLIWANPAASAKKIATVVGHPEQVTIFAYPAGAMMVGGFVAPAKRMSFFIHRNTDYSPDGIKLFDAAVDYLLAP